MLHMLHTIKQIRRMFSQCDGLLITAGAGMGVDSGLPDFHGKSGMLNHYPNSTQNNIKFQDIANPIGFAQSPNIAWGFYGHRHDLYKDTMPHEGFNILKDLSKTFENGCFVVTSNIDGHFQKAGYDVNKIFEIHGNINISQCSEPCSPELRPTPTVNIDEKGNCINIPKCHVCGATLRPNVLMFNDDFWISKLYDSQEVKFNNWTKQCKKILCIEIGADTNIQSIRMISERYQNTLIRINPKDFVTPSQNGVSLPLTANFGIQFIQHAVEIFED